MLPIRTIIVGAAIAGVLPAHADPLTDFRAGTTLHLAVANVGLGGHEQTSTGARLTKAAGSLDFTLNARDLGYPISVPVRLRGTVTSDGSVLYTASDVFSPAINLGGGLTLGRITGQLTARLRWVPGPMTSPHGNVSVQFASTSFFTVHGNFGSQNVALRDSRLIGGVMQPPLASFTTSALVCSDTTDKQHPFTLRLTSPARLTAAPIELETTVRGVQLPGVVLVSKDQREAIVNAKIERNFVGTVRVHAAAGGVTRALDIVVRRREECRR